MATAKQKAKYREYWEAREDEALKHYQKQEKEYDKEIQQIYQRQLDAIQKEISAFYGRYAEKEGISIAEAKKRVSKADIAEYERKAKKYVKEKNFSAQANEEMRLYNATMRINRLEMLKANIGLETIAGHDELEKYMAGILKGRTEEELARQAGILGKTIKNNAQLANIIPNASFHNATFSNRIWMNQDLLKSELSKLLQTGLIQGKNARVLARDLKKVFNTSTYNAERLMRTEMARAQTEAQKQSFIRNGFEQYEFIANSGCCDICKDNDGKIFNVEDMQPGENAAPMHPHCRCSVAAYSDREEYDAWLDYLAAGGTTEEWEKIKQNVASPMYRTYDDPMREKLGSAFDSHPAETKEIIERLKKKGIGVSYRDNTMGYQPNPTPGKGGQVIIEKDASFSAWLHEVQHVEDDEASGWQGFRNFINPHRAYQFEENAYDIEIDFARKMGYNDIVERLEKLKQKRKRELLPNETD